VDKHVDFFKTAPKTCLRRLNLYCHSREMWIQAESKLSYENWTLDRIRG